jgi:toxin-antitoxin system PIN domain toxin
MICPDANLLIYAYTPKEPFHAESRIWLESILSGPEAVGIPILSIHAFMRVQTDLRGKSRVPFEEAAAAVDSWLALPHVSILYPGVRHWQIYQQLAFQAQLRGTDLTDAAIAAIAQEHGGTIHTNDRDFARFPNLPCHYPLQP